jgi:hypothetical protein
MNPKYNRFSIPFLFNFILLITLILAFRTEIVATTLRLYINFFPNQHLEYLLGDYYQNAALLNHDLAYHFYINALQNKTVDIPNVSEKQKSMIQYRIGHLYFCGKGTTQNSKEAKIWFEAAQKSAEQATTVGQPISPAFKQTINRAITFSSQGTQINPGISLCRPQSESTFIANAFSLHQ